jgi:hypothetical protein
VFLKEKMMRHITFILLFIAVSMTAFAQKSEKPFWATELYYEDLEYSYVKAFKVVTEVTTDAMRAKAKQMLIDYQLLRTGERVIFADDETKNLSGLTIGAQEIRPYIDYEKEVGYFLFQVLKNPTYTFEKVQISDRYKFSPRVFVPGMAQIYKGSTGKGAVFISGEVVCIGGIIVGEMLRVSYENKVANTHNATLKQTYIDNANTAALVRNISIGAAAAVYAWNVIDGSVAKGKQHLLIGENPVKIVPYYSPNSGGVYLTFNF